MNSEEIRSKFLEFFKNRGHAIIPSASLVPENDPSVLFTTAGMQPLAPFLMGEKHPAGVRIVNVQKCVRTQDIDDVGDKTHDTFFEMLGNWSFGDYFKKEAIGWSYEFLTSKTEGLGLDPNRLYITCFGGDDDAPKDTESAEIWESLGIPKERIYFLGKSDNWWSPGDNGPCGPDTEMFYDVVGGLNLISLEEFKTADERQDIVEVWNDVFMEYEKKDGKVVGKLAQQNVDTGAGLERLSMVTQEKDNIFDTDLFSELIADINKLTEHEDTQSLRIVADHVRTSVFMITDGVVPSNTDRGYILRRLIRRAVRHADKLGIKEGSLPVLSETVIQKYGSVYPEIQEESKKTTEEFEEEISKFRKTLKSGLREFEKVSKDRISGKEAFTLFTTYGFPLELTLELALERDINVDTDAFNKEMEKHQELSRTSSEGKFRGGLAETSEKTTNYHSATHLLHQALREVLGSHVHQRGSNITEERLRFDFSHGEKMTEEQKEKVEKIVNEKIQEDLSVNFEEMEPGEAIKKGALGEFGAKYGEKVKVYSIGEGEERFSYEICGGPHVIKTGGMGVFKIKKEESTAAGIRRIKAVLE